MSEEATEEEKEEKEEAAGAELKTKTPHKDVGNKKQNQKTKQNYEKTTHFARQ